MAKPLGERGNGLVGDDGDLERCTTGSMEEGKRVGSARLRQQAAAIHRVGSLCYGWCQEGSQCPLLILITVHDFQDHQPSLDRDAAAAALYAEAGPIPSYHVRPRAVRLVSGQLRRDIYGVVAPRDPQPFCDCSGFQRFSTAASYQPQHAHPHDHGGIVDQDPHASHRARLVFYKTVPDETCPSKRCSGGSARRPYISSVLLARWSF